MRYFAIYTCIYIYPYKTYDISRYLHSVGVIMIKLKEHYHLLAEEEVKKKEKDRPRGLVFEKNVHFTFTAASNSKYL